MSANRFIRHLKIIHPEKAFYLDEKTGSNRFCKCLNTALAPRPWGPHISEENTRQTTRIVSGPNLTASNFELVPYNSCEEDHWQRRPRRSDRKIRERSIRLSHDLGTILLHRIILPSWRLRFLKFWSDATSIISTKHRAHQALHDSHKETENTDLIIKKQSSRSIGGRTCVKINHTPSFDAVRQKQKASTVSDQIHGHIPPRTKLFYSQGAGRKAIAKNIDLPLPPMREDEPQATQSNVPLTGIMIISWYESSNTNSVANSITNLPWSYYQVEVENIISRSAHGSRTVE